MSASVIYRAGEDPSGGIEITTVNNERVPIDKLVEGAAVELTHDRPEMNSGGHLAIVTGFEPGDDYWEAWERYVSSGDTVDVVLGGENLRLFHRPHIEG